LVEAAAVNRLRRCAAVAFLLSSFFTRSGYAGQLDRYIDPYYKANEPGGVVLVARKGVIVYERAFGLANVELGVPMRTDSVFCIASMTKQFTAVAVLQQVEKGTIRLTDTVGKFLPDYPPALKQVTIQQLLSHTGGVPNARSVASLLAVGRGWLGAEQVTATFKDEPLDFAPGSRWAYSNSGYQLLGLILEKATGEPYAEFIEKTLLVPAGMHDSFYGNDMRVVPRRASSYLHTRRGLENSVNGNVQIAFAAGALQSTAEDLLKWYRALTGGKLIKSETLRQAWTRAPLADGTPTDYGYGWFVGELQGSALVEHGGNMGGFMSHAIYFPAEELLVSVFLNSRGKRLPELIATDIAAAALGRPLRIEAIVVHPGDLKPYEGRYTKQDGTEVIIGSEDGKLFYQKAGAPKLTATPYARDKVTFENTSIIGEFRRDAQHRVTSLELQTLRGTAKESLARVEPR
jgi:CubicO group peptidase (beta-lactamase class C family)